MTNILVIQNIDWQFNNINLMVKLPVLRVFVNQAGSLF